MDPLPRLVASPGMPFDAVVAASEISVPPPASSGDVGYTAPAGPHVWVLRVGDRDLVFPGSRFTTLEIGAGRVARIRCVPVLEYISPGAAAELSGLLRGQLRETGFTEVDEVEPRAIEKRLPAEGEVRACRFRAGEWMGEVRVTRAIEAASEAGKSLSLGEDACLVSCTIWDVRGAAALIG